MSNENAISTHAWNENARMWDELMGEGSPFQIEIVDPTLEKMIPPITSQTRIVEIGCGNGYLARRLAKRGANVYAIDSSEEAISLAKARDSEQKVHFGVLDVINESICSQIGDNFDCVICNMALMDIAEMKPVFKEAIKLLREGGVFIITQTHPCFEKAVGPIFHEEGTVSGVKVSKYLTSSTMKARAVPLLPKEHLFFHRSLTEILQGAFEVGFVMDFFEERAFPESTKLTEHNGWHLLTEVPVIMGARFKKILGL